MDLGVIRKSCHLKDSKSKYTDDLTEFVEEKNNGGDRLLRSSMVRSVYAVRFLLSPPIIAFRRLYLITNFIWQL